MLCECIVPFYLYTAQELERMAAELEEASPDGDPDKLVKAIFFEETAQNLRFQAGNLLLFNGERP